MPKYGLLLLALALALSCGDDGSSDGVLRRGDGAYRLDIGVEGSLQNPAWSPDGAAILFTRFRNGYNREPADLMIYNLGSGAVRTLASDNSGNVNLPGAAWNAATAKVVFSSSREPHDEVYIIAANGRPGDEARITNRPHRAAYEPSFSPDGRWLVFESHPLGVEGRGVITKFRADGTGGYRALTAAGDDCRQPNWAPAGGLICYQKLAGGRWDIWVMDADGAGRRQVTAGAGDKTDASFAPDGGRLVYSSDEGGLTFANLFEIATAAGTPTRITSYDGYDGAPSWSPDGARVVFESCAAEPDGSPGTTLWVVAAPER